MPDSTIGNLPDTATAFADADLTVVEQGGTTKWITAADLATGSAFTARYVGWAPEPTGDEAFDQSNIQAMLDIAAAAPLGGVVYLQSGNYALDDTLNVRPRCSLIGTGSQSTTLTYSGVGWAIVVGNEPIGALLAYGCRVTNLGIVLTDNAGNGIRAAETNGVIVYNLYIEGVPSTNNSIGCMLDGGDTSNLFARLDTVIVNHCKYPHWWGASGSSYMTSATATNITGFGDDAAGSIGLFVEAASGQGSHIGSANFEHCATGLSISGVGLNANPVRFEANALDVLFNAGADGNKIYANEGLANHTDNSGRLSNTVEGFTLVGVNPATFYGKWRGGKRITEQVVLDAPATGLALTTGAAVLNAANDAWQDVDLSAVVPVGARSVTLLVTVRESAVGPAAYVFIRENGTTPAAGYVNCATHESAQQVLVGCDTGQVIEYMPHGFTAIGTAYLVIDVIAYNL